MLTLSGRYETVFNGSVDRSTTYLFVDSSDPSTILGELLYTLTRSSSNSQRVDATFWGLNSGRAFSDLGSGTVVTLGASSLTLNSPMARGATFFPSSNLEFEIGSAAVPEPATWAMMIGGFGLVGGAMRRRQRTAVTYA